MPCCWTLPEADADALVQRLTPVTKACRADVTHPTRPGLYLHRGLEDRARGVLFTDPRDARTGLARPYRGQPQKDDTIRLGEPCASSI